MIEKEDSARLEPVRSLSQRSESSFGGCTAGGDGGIPALRRHGSSFPHEADEADVGLTAYGAIRILLAMFRSSIPLMLSLFFSVSGLNIILFLFAGTYSSTSSQSAVFAGVSLSVTFTNVSFLSLLIGLGSAMETLGSQNNGAGHYRETGIVLQRSVLILSVISFPIAVLWYHATEVFLYFGVAPDVCEVLGTIMRVALLQIKPVISCFLSHVLHYLRSVLLPCRWTSLMCPMSDT
jgi:Na+-driven multidrug efflux pump